MSHTEQLQRLNYPALCALCFLSFILHNEQHTGFMLPVADSDTVCNSCVLRVCDLQTTKISDVIDSEQMHCWILLLFFLGGVWASGNQCGNTSTISAIYQQRLPDASSKIFLPPIDSHSQKKCFSRNTNSTISQRVMFDSCYWQLACPAPGFALCHNISVKSVYFILILIEYGICLLISVRSCKFTRYFDVFMLLCSTPNWWNKSQQMLNKIFLCKNPLFHHAALKVLHLLFFFTKRMLILITCITLKASATLKSLLYVSCSAGWKDISFVWESQAAVNPLKHKPQSLLVTSHFFPPLTSFVFC